MNKVKAQANMLHKQIRAGFVTNDHVLQIIKDTPRELFVLEKYKEFAYADMQLPIGHEQIMLRPQEEALILQSLQIKPTDNILEVGTGTGYFTALLAKLARRVTTVDIYNDFVQNAQSKLTELGISNVSFETKDILQQWFLHTSFDVIVFSAALPFLPKKYLQTLTLDGRFFVILGEAPVMTAAIFHHQAAHVWAQKNLFETRVPMMIGGDRKEKFVF